jgi:hypothetical protein
MGEWARRISYGKLDRRIKVVARPHALAGANWVHGENPEPDNVERQGYFFP